MALGAFATLTAELVCTGVELVSRDLEMAQLRKALTSRISIEQAKGVLAASQEVTPNERFQQLRARARSSDGAPPIASLVAARPGRRRDPGCSHGHPCGAVSRYGGVVAGIGRWSCLVHRLPIRAGHRPWDRAACHSPVRSRS